MRPWLSPAFPRPHVPARPGIETVGALDSTSALELTDLPASMLVLGAGYIGVELAQLFARAGVSVTLISRRGVLPEAESCQGWTPGQIQTLYDKVYQAWEPYQHMPSLLPADLKENYLRIQRKATREAREKGWQPPMEADGD